MKLAYWGLVKPTLAVSGQISANSVSLSNEPSL